MGWGKLLGDFAKGYIGERGIEGTMDDLNSLKNGVSKLFGSNEDYDDYDGDAYQQDWHKTIDAIYESYQNANYQEAVNALESFYRDHDEDYDFWYFYWRADIAYAQWLGAALDEVEDGHVELSSQCGMLESNARTWLSRAYDNIDEANEEVEREKYQKLSSTIMSDKEDINEFLKRNQEYLEEIKACLADNGTISDRERRILNRLRDSLCISEQRAKKLEDSLNKGLTDDEKDYLDALKDSLVDGVISNRERRLLDKLRTSLGISEARAKELEKSIF